MSYLWSIGGVANNDQPLTDEVSVYDIENRRWVSVDTRMPVPQTGGAAALHDGKIYIIGGSTRSAGQSDRVSIYDIATNSWSTGTAMPTARNRLGHTAPVYNGKIWVLGGYDGASRIATFEAYDIAADSWDSTVTNAPDTHSFPEPAVYNNQLWFFTGTVESGGGSIQRYDPASGTWDGPSAFTAHPDAVTDGGGTLYNGRYHAVGGWSNKSGGLATEDKSVDSHYAYDFDTDSWELLSTFPDRWSHGAVETDGTYLYVYQGRYDFEIGNQSTMDMTGDTWRWQPSGSWEKLATTINNKFNFHPAHTTATPTTESVSLREPSIPTTANGTPDAVDGALHPLVTDALVGYWPMWAQSGSTVHDESGNGHDGTATNLEWTYNDDVQKPAISGGGDGYVTCGSPATFESPNFNGGFTLMVECTPTATDLDGNRHYVVGKTTSGAVAYALRFETDIRLEMYDGSTFVGPSTAQVAGSWTPSAGETYRIIMWHNRDEVRMYVNGEFVIVAETAGQTDSGGDDPLTFGDRNPSNGQPFYGDISAVALWNEPLPLHQLQNADGKRRFAAEENVQ